MKYSEKGIGHICMTDMLLPVTLSKNNVKILFGTYKLNRFTPLSFHLLENKRCPLVQTKVNKTYWSNTLT